MTTITTGPAFSGLLVLLLLRIRSNIQTGLSVPKRTVPYIGPSDSVRLALDTFEREPYIPPVRYGTIYFASGTEIFWARPKSVRLDWTGLVLAWPGLD